MKIILRTILGFYIFLLVLSAVVNEAVPPASSFFAFAFVSVMMGGLLGFILDVVHDSRMAKKEIKYLTRKAEYKIYILNSKNEKQLLERLHNKQLDNSGDEIKRLKSLLNDLDKPIWTI